MKKVLFSVAMIAVFVGVMMTSCKKENETVSNEKGQIEVNDPQNDAEVSRILDFKKKVDERKANPGMKSGETMTLEEAMDNVVDLFNVTYTEPTAYYTATESHQFSINVPLTVDGEVLVDDVVAAYEQAVTEARGAYHASLFANKGYRCLMVTFEMLRENEVRLDFNGSCGERGTTPPTPQPHIDGPFSEGDDWLCGGHYQGKCDDPSIPGNAAEKLTEQLFLKISGELPTVPEGCRMVFLHDTIYTFSGPEYLGIYYTEDLDDTCIGWMYLNDYYAGEINNIYRILPGENEFSLTALYTFGRYYVASAVVICENHENEYPGFHKHVTSVQYGRLGYVNNDVIGFENL